MLLFIIVGVKRQLAWLQAILAVAVSAHALFTRPPLPHWPRPEALSMSDDHARTARQA